MDGCLGFLGTEQRHNQQHINTEGAFVVYKTSDGARNACLQTDSTISSLSITYHIMKLSYGKVIRGLLW